MDTKQIEMRQKLLNKFCVKISKFQTIFQSEEMKIFFSNITDIKKGLGSLPNQTYEEIHLKYKRAFPDYYESYEAAPARVKINEFQVFLKKALANLKV